MQYLAEIIKALGQRPAERLGWGAVVVIGLAIAVLGFLCNTVIERGMSFEHGATKITVPVKPGDGKAPS